MLRHRSTFQFIVLVNLCLFIFVVGGLVNTDVQDAIIIDKEYLVIPCKPTRKNYGVKLLEGGKKYVKEVNKFDLHLH